VNRLGRDRVKGNLVGVSKYQASKFSTKRKMELAEIAEKQSIMALRAVE
jgi:hypothetical protein